MVTEKQVIQTAIKFNLKAKKVFLIKTGVYRVVSAKGKPYCLKRMRYSSERLRWMDQTLQKLRTHGFATVAWRRPHTATGRTLFVRSSKQPYFYILTPWIQGRMPSIESCQDLRTCATTLADFHLAGQKIKISTAGAPNMLGRWPNMLNDKARMLFKNIQRAEKNESSAALTGLLHTHGDWLAERVHKALKLLDETDYALFCRKAANKGVLCHGDSGPKNFVLSQKGNYLIDFETLRIDLRTYDLFRLIRLSCKSSGWNIDTARCILDGYQAVSKLEPIEYDLLRVWLQFPYKACKLLSSYEHANQQHRRRLEHKLANTIKDEQDISVFLNRLDSYRNRK
ncbi:phosphotransferase [Aneurinibacillus sp. Ricciae_BoGa-3]|uniref:phosphotransferase n=1 Tax=Aneurinibacillus sp. Ricciae_BoGa-3 TaxID=3022697 RepID=UPI0023402158|nr:phosphotransferase [Aneurinibacillus sp. Ricciae_BoGa-3]WCK56386.1 phosphotransferase [Aneurinibacillus sp. Ricciae_BoGa-3]